MSDADPRYPHDCDHCIYLGQWEEYDLYVCKSRNKNPIEDIDTTIIGRYGEAGDYCSGIAFRDHIPCLREAFKRAVERGILDPKKYRKYVRCACGVLREESPSEPCLICGLKKKLDKEEQDELKQTKLNRNVSAARN